MNSSYSKKEAINIIKQALTNKDRHLAQDEFHEQLELKDIESAAEEFDVSRTELQKAVTEVTEPKEQKRETLFPEIVATRWISGQLTEEDIESLFAELKIVFGGSYRWSEKPSQIQKMGSTWEYYLQDAMILLTERADGYELRVIKHQFFHGNNIEAYLLAIPIALLAGAYPISVLVSSNLFAAIIIVDSCYMGAFFAVKKYTQKKRADKFKNLLHITGSVEERLQKISTQN